MNRFEDHDVHEPLPVEEEIQDSVLEWLARDSCDHVALFTAVAAADVSPAVLDSSTLTGEPSARSSAGLR